MKNISILFAVLLFSKLVAAQTIDTSSIRNHLEQIVNTPEARNYQNTEVLNNVAKYIYNEFGKYADTVYYQTYLVGKKEYKNVVCVFGNDSEKTIVIGAHYDVCGDQDGADDNATGVVGLLELAKKLQGQKLKHRLELVAYTLEEPPFFRTQNMGSYVHAKSLHDKAVDVYGMISIEMIGYFDDSKKSQDYPIGLLSLFYGSRGNYITLVNKMSKEKFSRKFNSKFKKQHLVKTKKFSAPAKLPGIDFSDHLNYWLFDYSALMITDTGFNRNKNYHEGSDTIETLDLLRMSKVIETIYEALMDVK